MILINNWSMKVSEIFLSLNTPSAGSYGDQKMVSHKDERRPAEINLYYL